MRTYSRHTCSLAAEQGGDNNKGKKVLFPRILLAVGPESGWEEPRELDLFTKKHGFHQVTLGPRVLRSETAVPALLALCNDLLDSFEKDE